MKKTLSELFAMTNLGARKQFLGMKLDRSPDGLFLSQYSYMKRLIDSVGMADAKPKRIVLPLGHILYEKITPTTEEDKRVMKDKPYRKVLGALLCLSTRTRPDISIAVSLLGKFQADPGPPQWKYLQHLVRYLIHTPEYGLYIKSKSDTPRLEAYSDTYWARYEHKCRSRSRYVLTINSAPIIWSSKLQPTTSLSSSDAEFVALQGCVREVDWVRLMLRKIGQHQT